MEVCLSVVKMKCVLVFPSIYLTALLLSSVQSSPVRFTDLDDDDDGDLDEAIVRGAVHIGREIGGLFFGLVLIR